VLYRDVPTAMTADPKIRIATKIAAAAMMRRGTRAGKITV